MMYMLYIHLISYHFFEQTQTKPNNCTTMFLPTVTIHFVCKDSLIFSFLPSFLICSELPLMIDKALQIWSDRLARHSALYFDFQLTNFNNSTGVGTSICCFCLDYHTSLLSLYFQATCKTNDVSNGTNFYNTFLW